MSSWQDHPFAIQVKAGETKHFCRCGKTQNPPFCDGTHKGSGITPYVEKFDQDKSIYACGCLKSGKRPYCDGSHKK